MIAKSNDEAATRDAGCWVAKSELKSRKYMASLARGEHQGGEAYFVDEELSAQKISALLSSGREAEVLLGIKWLLGMMTKGKDCRTYFAAVVKNVVAPSVEVKKLVYLYVSEYGDVDDTCRSLVLLSVNSFQKDLSNSNALLRALALRVLTNVRVADIAAIQELAVTKCAKDASPYVRKCAAHALVKIGVGSDASKSICSELLSDSSTMVLGAALHAVQELSFPDELLDPVFRKLCHLLADLDEWSQVVALQLLERYLRRNFLDPEAGASTNQDPDQRNGFASLSSGQSMNAVLAPSTATKKKKQRMPVPQSAGFYSDDEEDATPNPGFMESDDDESDDFAGLGTSGQSSTGAEEQARHHYFMDPDHGLALRCSVPLLKSRNTAVVVAVCSLHLECGDGEHLKACGKALVRVVRSKREIGLCVLSAALALAARKPQTLAPYLSDFFVASNDPSFIQRAKLNVLVALGRSCGPEAAKTALTELQTYAASGRAQLAADAVAAAVDVVLGDGRSMGETVAEGLLAALSCSARPQLAKQAAAGLRRLAPALDAPAALVLKLAGLLLADRLPTQAHPDAVCLVARYADTPDVKNAVLVKLLVGFAEKPLALKRQLLQLSLRLNGDDPKSQTLAKYVLELASFDTNVDLRDQARFLKAAPPLPNPSFPAHSNLLHNPPDFGLGSLSSLVDHSVTGYKPIPDWPLTQPDPSRRDALTNPKPAFGGPSIQVEQDDPADDDDEESDEDHDSDEEDDDDDDDDDDDSDDDDGSDSDEDDSDDDDGDDDSEEDDDDGKDEDDEDDDDDDEEEEDDDDDDSDVDSAKVEMKAPPVAPEDPFALLGEDMLADSQIATEASTSSKSSEILSLYSS